MSVNKRRVTWILINALCFLGLACMLWATPVGTESVDDKSAGDSQQEAICGNGTCEAGEHHFSCPEDCPEPVCGNGTCEYGETILRCPQDCGDGSGDACSPCNLPAVVGGAEGLNDTYWLSEAMLFNPGVVPVTFTIHFTPDDPIPTSSSDPYVLDGGSAWYFSNFVDELFEMTEGSEVGSMRIESNGPLMIGSRTFNSPRSKDGGGTFGQYIPALGSERAFGREDTAYIIGIQENESFRTNLIIQEVTGVKTFLLVTVYDADGGQIGSHNLMVNGHKKVQSSFKNLDSGFAYLQDAYATVEIVNGGRVVALSSVIVNATGDPKTVTAADPYQVNTVTKSSRADAPYGTMEAHYLVPIIARVDGERETYWRTSAELMNPFIGRQVLVLEYVHSSGGIFTNSQVIVEGGGQRSFADLVSEAFPDAPEGSGSLHIYAPNGIFANTDSYNDGNAGRFGQNIPALGGVALLQSGETGMLLLLASTASFRTNLGFAELDGIRTEVLVELYDTSERGIPVLQASRPYTVPAKGNRQINRVFEDMGADKDHPSAIAFVTVLGDGRIYAYASKVDNITGDPTFIPAQRLR